MEWKGLSGGGRGDLQRVVCAEVGSPAGVQATCGIRGVSGDRLSKGILSYCKGYCGRAGRGAECGAEHVTSRGSKAIRLLCNSNLDISIPSRGSEEKRIRICLQAWSNILIMDIRK